MKYKFIYSFIVLFVIALVLFLNIFRIEPFESFSLKFNDVNFKLQTKEISQDVVLVAIDEASINKYGRWPWDRDIIANGLSHLKQADIVLFDMIFSETTDDKNDKALAKSIFNLNNSVCGFFLRDKSTQLIDDNEMEILKDSALDLLQSQVSQYTNPKFISSKYAEINIASVLEACSLSASFSTLSESDHLMRSYPLAVYYQNILYPSLGTQALRIKFQGDVERLDSTHIKIADKTVSLDKKGFVKLNYYDLQQYKIISFLDVVNLKVSPNYFKGKIVILGVVETGATDIVATPIGNIPGPLLHYTFLSNFFKSHLITDYKSINYILVVLMAILPLFIIFFIKKVLYRAIINIVIYCILYIFLKYIFIKYMIYIDLFYPLLSLLLSLAILESITFNIQEKKDKFLIGAFSSYLSSDLLDKLLKNPDSLSLGGENKELSILFSDIRGFTTISESMKPENLVNLLNDYFTPMTRCVLDNGGMLDKYIGDAIMAFFNAPLDMKFHADSASKSALDMMKKLKILNNELILKGIEPIKIGIGINTANVVVGNMGSEERFNYTIVGDGVNLASRVEGLTREYGVDILMTEFTVKKLTQNFIYREVESVQVKGKKNFVLIYELMLDTQKSIELKKVYDKALNMYKNGDLKRAEKLFSDIVSKYDDNLSKYFLVKINNGKRL